MRLLIPSEWITEMDVISGRGGQNTHRVGHQTLLYLKDQLQDRYLMATSNKEKRLIQLQLRDEFHALGGRFVMVSPTMVGYHEILTKEEIVKKVGQCLREPRKKQNVTMPIIPNMMIMTINTLDHIASKRIFPQDNDTIPMEGDYHDDTTVINTVATVPQEITVTLTSDSNHHDHHHQYIDYDDDN